MLELSNLLRECYSAYTNYDCQACQNFHYCQQRNAQNDCFYCLQRIHYQSDANHFTYNCPKMVYRYVIHYFCRFCSEIYYSLENHINNFNIENLNIVSLGCGPNSEIYGIIEALRLLARFPHINYIGFDTNRTWIPIWTLNQMILDGIAVSQQYPLLQPDDFFSTNPQTIDLLVMNYLLSDVSRQDTASKNNALNNFSDFIIVQRPTYILFNDISFFTNSTALNSGYGCFLDLMRNVVNRGVICHSLRKGTFHAPNYYTPKALTPFSILIVDYTFQ